MSWQTWLTIDKFILFFFKKKSRFFFPRTNVLPCFQKPALRHGLALFFAESLELPKSTSYHHSHQLFIFISAPFTKYRFMTRAFTKRREGPASENLVVITDTEAPSPPRVTNITCFGVNELLVEWRRPEITYDHVINGKISLWRILTGFSINFLISGQILSYLPHITWWPSK